MNIPTAEEFIEDRYDLNSEQLEKIKENMSKMPMIDFDNIPDLMISFAKLHVKAALQEALESIPCLGSSTDIASYEEVEKAVLNSYPLSNIK